MTMKKLFAILVATAFAATSFAALAQDKGGKEKSKAKSKPAAEQKAPSKDKMSKSKGKAKGKDAK